MAHPDKVFTDAVQEAIKSFEVTSGHHANRTHQMIERYGEVEALSRLMLGKKTQKGYRTLRDNDQVNKTFERIILDFKQYFKDDIINQAQDRINHPEKFE
jgi:hypothetical protein